MFASLTKGHCEARVQPQADPQCLEPMGGCWGSHQGNLQSHLQPPEGTPLEPCGQTSTAFSPDSTAFWLQK